MFSKTEKDKKDRVIDILTRSFKDNQSVNFIVKQDHLRDKRTRRLMAYAVKVCAAFGEVLLSEDGNACALAVTRKKGFSLRPLWWDLQLIFGVCGIANVGKVLWREKLIGLHHPKGRFYYLWFIGVDPEVQGLDRGSALLEMVILRASGFGLAIYLETSTLANLPWYQGHGFQLFHELDIGYTIYFLRKSAG